MKQLIDRIAQKPLVVIIAVLAVTVLFVVLTAQRAALETDLDAYMPSDHPAFVYSDEAEDLFGIADAVLIAVEHPETIFQKGTLQKIKDISYALPNHFDEISPKNITSLYTADNITGSDWGLEVEPFYRDAPSSEAELASLREAVEGNEMIYGRIVSIDGRSSLIIAEMASQDFSTEFYEGLQRFAAQWEGPETIYIAGRSVVEGELAKLGPEDMTRMAPLVAGVMIILLLLLLRSIRHTVITLAVVSVGTIVSFGLMSMFRIPVYSVHTMIPVMLIAIGSAYGIHMHTAIAHIVCREPNIAKGELVRRTLQRMIRPVSMAAVTTAVGFSALMTSQVLPVRYFGFFSAIGVLAEMVLALMLFPASIYLLGPPRLNKKKQHSEVFWKNPSADILRRPRIVMAAAAAVVAVAVLGAGRVWIDTSFLANFQEDSSIVQTDNFVNTHFGGTSTLHVVFEADREDAFKEPEVLSRIDALQREVEQNPFVGSSFALTDYLRRMHKVMHEDDPAYDAVPQSRELVAQYLLLYEMSGDPETLDKVVDFEYQHANLTFQLKSDSSSVMSGITDTVEAYRGAFEALGISVNFAGSGYKALVFSDLLLEGQIISLGLSFVVVAVILALLFKSLLLGLVGIIPIAITAVVNFGTMGLLNIPLSSATALISSIAIGIGVDYAIHLIEYYRFLREGGEDTAEAARRTMAHTGKAILFNAAAVMGGFSVLLFSVFPPNRQVGGLVALNMAVSAVSTLTVLLVVLVLLDRKNRMKHRRSIPVISREQINSEEEL